MSKKVVTLLNKYGPMLSGELARKFEHEYGASNTAARQALSRAKKPVNKICTLSFDKNQKFFYLESQYMSNRYIERLMDAIKQSSQINWVYICAFQSQNGFVAKSILPSLVSSPIKNVKGHKLHQRVIDDLLKCGIIVEYNETHSFPIFRKSTTSITRSMNGALLKFCRMVLGCIMVSCPSTFSRKS